jgi:hypothetical protein
VTRFDAMAFCPVDMGTAAQARLTTKSTGQNAKTEADN